MNDKELPDAVKEVFNDFAIVLSLSPRRGSSPLRSVCDDPCCLRLTVAGSAPGKARLSGRTGRPTVHTPGGRADNATEAAPAPAQAKSAKKALPKRVKVPKAAGN